MAINKWMMAALKALSYPDIDLKKHYKLARTFSDHTKLQLGQPLCRCWDHVIQTEDIRIPVRIFSPYEVGEYPLLIFFHGGGWVTGNIDSYTPVCTHMADLTRHTVLSVDYRLAPEHPFPSGLMDCYQVTREIFLHPQSFPFKADQIALIGDSAGGNLAAAVSLMARNRGEFHPARQILIYPATYNDHTSRSPFPSVVENGSDYLLTSKRICDYMALYQSCDGDRLNPYFAPYLAEDLSRQPDTLILTAQYDPLRDEGEAYGRRLQEAGNRVVIHRIADALHGFFSLPPSFQLVQQAYEHINLFLKSTSDGKD